MNPNTKIMLERIYDLLSDKFQDPVKAWDSLVEFVATDHQASLPTKLDHKFEWLHGDHTLADKLSQLYDAELLRADYHDHLGELYREKLPSETLKANVGQLDLALHRWTQQEQKGPRVAMLDPVAGSGSLLMAVHKRLPRVVLFGVDYDLRALRVAMTNFAIHNIQGYLLHADKDKHDISLETPEGQYNWQHANQWYSNMDQLKPVRAKPGKNPGNRK